MPARTTKDDEVLLRYAVKNYIVTASELAQQSGRGVDVISRRLRMLGPHGRVRDGERVNGLGYLARTVPPFSRHGEDLYYPMQPAFDLALERGWIEQPCKATDRAESTKLLHDLRVRAFRLALKAEFSERVYGTLHYYELHHRWGKAEEDHILPDYLFYLDRKPNYPTFFVEVERTNEHSYDERGISSRVRKLESYLDYHARGLFQERFHYPDFRVLLIVRTAKKAENLAQKLHDIGGELDSRKFWITDFESSLNVTEKVWLTPTDSRTRRYSLLDA